MIGAVSGRARQRRRVGAILGILLMLGPSVPGSAQSAAPKKKAAASSPAKATPRKPAAAKSAAAKPAAKPAAAKASSARKPAYSAAAARARRTKLARARAAARARELAALVQPRFKTDAQGDVVPDIRAEAAIIYNPSTGQILWEERAFDSRSIASITKVMTALCVLDDESDLDELVQVERVDTRGANVTHLRAGERVSRHNLLHLLLVASDNAAARTLARTAPGGAKAFVARMNQRAAELGLQDTRYVDPSGLLSDNVSSAYDMARLIAFVAEDEFVSEIMRKADYSFRTSRRALTIHSTNQLLRAPGIDVRGGKTGFISRSGYCLAALLRLPSVDQTVAVVVLGARSNAGRFWETRHLLNWINSKSQFLIGSDED